MPKKETPKSEKTKVTKKPAVKKAVSFIRVVGRRKNAVARVRLMPKGKGKIEINGQDYKKYFPYFELNQKIIAPLVLVGKEKAFDFSIKVVGGGKSGQAEACRHGISRALIAFNEDDYKIVLKKEGYLTRDPRSKERKKPGLKRARRAPQWSKR